MPFPPSAACRFFDLPPVNLQNLPLHLTKNSFASAPTHLCGIAFTKRFRLCGGEAVAFRSPPPPLRSPTNRLVSSQTLAGRGGSVSRRDHNQAYRRRTQSQAEPIKEKSRNSNASRSSGGSAREGLLSEKPPPSQASFSPRRQVAAALSAVVTTTKFIGNRPHLAWAHKSEGSVKPIPSCSSGEGARGRGASLREAASPPESPHSCLFGREREGGERQP